MENSHSTSYKKDLDKLEVMEGVNMLDKKEFDLWADGYDKTVGISDEKTHILLLVTKRYLDSFFRL